MEWHGVVVDVHQFLRDVTLKPHPLEVVPLSLYWTFAVSLHWSVWEPYRTQLNGVAARYEVTDPLVAMPVEAFVWASTDQNEPGVVASGEPCVTVGVLAGVGGAAAELPVASVPDVGPKAAPDQERANQIGPTERRRRPRTATTTARWLREGEAPRGAARLAERDCVMVHGRTNARCGRVGGSASTTLR